MPNVITLYGFVADEKIRLEIKYDWFNSPHKDYTVKVHSKMNVPITNSDGITNQLHADGQ
jgi:hypothetical protein